MIAQSQEPQQRDDPPAMVFARRLVAAKLLSGRSQSAGQSRRAAWKLWLVMASVAAVVAACSTHWLGLW